MPSVPVPKVEPRPAPHELLAPVSEHNIQSIKTVSTLTQQPHLNTPPPAAVPALPPLLPGEIHQGTSASACIARYKASSLEQQKAALLAAVSTEATELVMFITFVAARHTFRETEEEYLLAIDEIRDEYVELRTFVMRETFRKERQREAGSVDAQSDGREITRANEGDVKREMEQAPKPDNLNEEQVGTSPKTKTPRRSLLELAIARGLAHPSAKPLPAPEPQVTQSDQPAAATRTNQTPAPTISLAAKRRIERQNTVKGGRTLNERVVAFSGLTFEDKEAVIQDLLQLDATFETSEELLLNQATAYICATRHSEQNPQYMLLADSVPVRMDHLRAWLRLRQL